MKNRFYSMLALLICLIMAMSLCAGMASAEEGFLGKPFPDFTATDTEGNTFTLSEALKDHEAVLINFWATWCGPCQMEFPFLNEAWEKYRDRVAFIALSKEKKDTIEKIAEYRQENGILFPMGRDEDNLYASLDAKGIPVTVIVDRFGNAVFFHLGSFVATDAVARVLDAFLGEGYTETAVLDGIPLDTSTRAFPVSAARSICPDSGSYREVTFRVTSVPKPFTGYIVPEDSIRLRLGITADDDVTNMTYMDAYQYRPVNIRSLLDPERGVFVYDQEMPGASDEEQFTRGILYDSAVDEDEKAMQIFLFRNEDAITQLADALKKEGEGELTWEYADTNKEAENTAQAYIVHVTDQYGEPVEEVAVNFCTDSSCTPQETDETGTIAFEGKPYRYHVQIVDVPEGYSWDESFDMYTTLEYGEWALRVRKD